MASINGSWFATSASLKTSLNFCSLPIKPSSIIWPHSFHASNSGFLGKVPLQHTMPKVRPSTDSSVKAANTADSGVAFLKNQESSSSKENKLAPDTTVLRRKKVFRQEKNVKRLNTNTAQRIVLDNYGILQYPLRTEAAVNNIANNNTLVFVVDKRADKKCIRDAAKSLFNIQTKKINTSISPDGIKKAFLMLVPEQNASEVAKKLRIF